MTEKNYGLIESIPELAKFARRLVKGGGPIAFDIETGYTGPDQEKASLHPETAIIAGISFTNSTDWARYAPLGHNHCQNLNNYEAARILWLVLRAGRGVAHNAGFELRHLSKWFREQLWDDPTLGAEVRAANGYFPIRADTQIEAYLAAEYEKFGLKLLTKELFGHTMIELHELFEGLAKNKRKMLRFNILELSPRVVKYACEDSVWCLAIHQRYHEQVKDMLLYPVEHGIVQDCVPEMEDFGVRYDWGRMRRAVENIKYFRDTYNAEIMQELTQLLGKQTAVNLGSPPALRRVLYDQLGLRTTVYTDSTKDKPKEERVMSTGKIALTGLAKQYPVVKKILEWKEMTRLLGTYLEKYETLYQYAEDGHCHPNHMSAVVVTGRFAVSDPPYQQCVPGSYQVLTPHGWERLDKLPDGVPVAQYIELAEQTEGAISFVTPEVVRTPYHGDMIEFRSSEGGNWRYTPNHRIVYRQRQKSAAGLSPMRESTAEQWERGLLSQTPSAQGRRLHDRYMQKAGSAIGGVLLSGNERESLRLAVAVQADGSRTNGHQYDIAVHKPRKVAALVELGLNPEQQSKGRWRVRVPVYQVSRWLDDAKDFRADAILRLHADDLRWFVAEVMQWDGDATRGCTYGQKTVRRKSVDVVQAAACLAGYSTSLYERPGYDAVTVNMHPRPHKGFGWQEPVRLPNEDGMVYCVTVPTGMFLCRNDQGKVLVTGNSPKKYHFDLEPARQAHAEGRTPPPGTCFKFNFRDCITAPPDHYILGFDLSQAELRAIAGEAQETALLHAFETGQDVHTLTAALMLRIPIEQVDDELRSIGKTLNFAMMYGMGVKGLADRLGISIDEAQALYDSYFSAYPNIARWAKNQVDLGKSQGYVTSRFGRKLPIWEFKSDKEWIRSKGERACVNYPIQGAATGDYMKIAMVKARRAIRKAGLQDRVHMVMNVHDALEFYVHKSVQPVDLVKILKSAVVFEVPGWPSMQADWHLGKRWGSPKEVEVLDDGRLIVKDGEKEIEIVSSEEEDEETGELVPVLPDVDPDAVRKAAALIPAQVRAPVQETTARRLIVELTEMPAVDRWQRFKQLLADSPGPNTLTLRTPEGDLDIDLDRGTSLTPADTARVSMLLGVTRLIYDAADVDTAELVQGLTL